MISMSVCIDVEEIQTAKRFYTEALGLQVVRAGDDMCELKANDTTVYLVQRESGTNPIEKGSVVRSYERHWTPVHLDFSVADMDRCVTAIDQLGGSLEGTKSGDWGSVSFCADPFGNGFCVMKMNATA